MLTLIELQETDPTARKTQQHTSWPRVNKNKSGSLEISEKLKKHIFKHN